MVKREFTPDKGKGILADFTNGGDGSGMDVDSEPNGGVVTAHRPTMDDLPDEIQHITADILPLNLILARLAQFSHGTLQDTIAALASKPVPQITANGNASYQYTGADDTSPESLEKKTTLLKTIQDLHTRWVKALVITEWSKKSEKVSKLIDIRSHLAAKVEEFNMVFWDLIKVKHELHWAKLPSPDLKTALEILTSGEVSWMPELGYLEPPPITVEEKDVWIDNINTMLSVRLSFDEYDKIPLAFRDYSIDSGRVTFKVKGGFEVDLTIGDEDFEKQFWFIDFRFLFTPAQEEVSEPVRTALEVKVNHALATDGLAGCYKYLHEFVLTQKITEFWRQAVELSRARWIDTLSVERLNRAMAIQYWVNRPHSQGSKSWIILGVSSGNGPSGLPDPKSPSRLSLRWFRDNKEVKDFDIPFDAETISVEDLLTTVIARHVEYLLGSIYNKLLSKPRFALRQARLALEVSKEEPSESSLTLQLFDHENAAVRVDTMTGSFIMLPPSPLILEGQRKINSSPNPAEEGPAHLEQIRCTYTMRDLSSRAKSIGWTVLRGPITQEEVKNIVHSSAPPSRDTFQAVWMRKIGWTPQWFVMMSISLGGDQWWLVELSSPQPGAQTARLKMFTKMPMSSGQLSLSDTFFQNLTVYTSGMISHITDLRELHTKRVGHAARPSTNYSLPPQITMPTLFVRLSDMLRSRKDATDASSSTPWAKDFIPIIFRGVQSYSEDETASEAGSPQQKRDSRIKIIAEAKLAVTNKAKFQLLKGSVGHDIVFDGRAGQFTLQLRADMGTPMVTLLESRIRALERLVDFVEAIRRAGQNVVAERVTLREVVFAYRSSDLPTPATLPGLLGGPPPPHDKARVWTVRLDLGKDTGVDIKLEKGNPHLRVLDYLRQAASSPSFESLPTWFLATLPLFRGLDKIEDAWEPIAMKNEGSFQAFHKGLNWVTIRFALATPLGAPRRMVGLDIKPRIRKGKTMWHVYRPDITGGGGSAAWADPSAAIKSRNDEFDKVLKEKVWSTNAEGIRVLGMGAAADMETGIEPLLSMIDAAIRSLVGTPPPPAPQPQLQEQAIPVAPAPQPLGPGQGQGQGLGQGQGPIIQPQQQQQPARFPQSTLQQQRQHAQQQHAHAQQHAQAMAAQQHAQQQHHQQQQQQHQQQQHQQHQQQQHQQRGGGGMGTSSAPLVVD